MPRTTKRTPSERQHPVTRYHSGVRPHRRQKLAARIEPLHGDVLPPTAAKAKQEIEESSAKPAPAFMAWPSQMFELMMAFWANFTPLGPMLTMRKHQPASGNPVFPKTETKETDSEYLYRIALPGLQRSQVHLGFHEHSLMLRVQAPSGKRQVRGRPQRTRSIHRALPLPVYTDASAIAAYMRDGVLTIAIPKTEKPVPPRGRTIDIT